MTRVLITQKPNIFGRHVEDHLVSDFVGERRQARLQCMDVGYDRVPSGSQGTLFVWISTEIALLEAEKMNVQTDLT